MTAGRTKPLTVGDDGYNIEGVKVCFFSRLCGQMKDVNFSMLVAVACKYSIKGNVYEHRFFFVLSHIKLCEKCLD